MADDGTAEGGYPHVAFINRVVEHSCPISRVRCAAGAFEAMVSLSHT
jgi:hypothetical protein